MSDPKGEKPHPEHPPEQEFELEFVEDPPHATSPEGPHGQDHIAPEEAHPVDALNINASMEEFHFSGPAEELDFTEPADFTFPTEAAADVEHVADSSAEFPSAEFPGVEHAGLEHLFGSEEAAPYEAAAVEEAAGEAAPAAEVEAAEAEGEKETEVKPKRELPAWVPKLEWTTVAVLSAAAVIGLIVSPFFLESGNTVSLIVNICCPLMLALVAYALWRSSRRWTTPAVSALYTALLALSAAALIGGTWVEGMELSGYKWQYGKARVAAGKPPQHFVPPPPAQK